MLAPLLLQFGNLGVVWHLECHKFTPDDLSLLRKGLLLTDLLELMLLIGFASDCNRASEAIYGSLGIVFVITIEFGVLKDLIEQNNGGGSNVAPGAILVDLGDVEVEPNLAAAAAPATADELALKSAAKAEAKPVTRPSKVPKPAAADSKPSTKDEKAKKGAKEVTST